MSVPDELKQDLAWQNLTRLCEMLNLEQEQVEGQVERMYEEPFLKGIGEGLPRWKQAAIAVYARHNRENVVKVEPYVVRVLSIEAPRVITTKDKKKMRLSSAMVLAKSKRAGAKMALGNMTFYDTGRKDDESNADRINDIEVGKTYETLLAGGFRDGTYKLTADRRAKFDNEVVVEDQPDVTEVINKLYPRVMAADLHKYVSKMVQVEGSVVIAMARPSKKGNMFGKYTLVDESLTPDMIQEGKAVQVMCNAEQVKYGPESRIIIIGKVTKSQEWGLGMGATMVIPLYEAPQEEVEDESEGGGESAVDFSEFEDEAEEGEEYEEPQEA